MQENLSGSPFLGLKNSSDSATVHSVVIETIEKLLKLGTNLDNICCLLPTAVLIDKKHLKQSFEVFKKKQDKFLIGISKFSSPPQKGFLLKSKSNLSLYDKKKLLNKTQDYENIYFDAGQFYLGKFRNYLKNRDFRKIYFKNKSAGFVINQNEIQDIDDLDDLELAKIKFTHKNKKKSNSLYL